ncbi:complement C3-like isoform X2 [Python bivittatus]|uniref:Complement C3-like isoform X2 n=1 Tax=Python bivittatus TaxID=176946 RepID=A0A9F5IS36_PYTBI|nr:complement C3-like isoform X2 [Python bivittatus]
MEGTALYLIAALMFCFPATSYSQLYSLILPNVLWTDCEEKIVLEAHGLNIPVNVIITVFNFPEKSLELYKTRVILDPANGMMATAVIKIAASQMNRESKQNQYVLVEARCTQFILHKVVLTALHSGYIFIKTDKDIYRPGSFVHTHIFSSDHNLMSLDKVVAVRLQAPEGIVIHQKRVLQHDFSRPFNLPEDASLGTWKIEANYENTPQTTFSAEFEVQRAELPGFEVRVEPSKKYFYINEKEFKVSIIARFLWGKGVNGVAFVHYGVQMDNTKNTIAGSLKKILINDGRGEAILTTAMMQNRFHNLTELIGHFLYVSATVSTESGPYLIVTEEASFNIVAIPYEINLTKTSQHFKPGMPYDLMVYVSNPDGSPAPKVSVVAELLDTTEWQTAVTNSDGAALLILNVPQGKKEISIRVKTNDQSLPAENQASKTIVTTAYETQEGSGNYLHVQVLNTGVKVGDNLQVKFIINPNLQTEYFTYLILNKGKVLTAQRQPRPNGQNEVTLFLHITPNFIPSFRIVTYCLIGSKEIVADSVWVDVKDTCIGTLVLKGESSKKENYLQPSAAMKIKLEGDAGSRVGVVIMDKRVNVHRITQKKIWESVEENDIGCTPGGGRNNLAVFTDAGLALETNIKLSTLIRLDRRCPQHTKRHRRSIQLYKASTVAQDEDQGQDWTLQKCCEYGMLCHDCEKQVGFMPGQNACKNIFLECCRFHKNIQNVKQRDKRSTGRGSSEIRLFLKDTITTWETVAVGISKETGICVSEPYPITTWKNFFIDLQLPNSVVRNEQTEIQAILYNYQEKDITVRVHWLYKDNFCSASTAKASYQQVVIVKSQSFIVLPFVIVPLNLGEQNVEVTAAIWNEFLGDGVQKRFTVVPEGMPQEIVKIVDLHPAQSRNGVQVIRIPAYELTDIVPLSPLVTRITLARNPRAEFIETYINMDKVHGFFITPDGDEETNIIAMTPLTSVTHYFDNTGQWDKIGTDDRSDAIQKIMHGYRLQLSFMQVDYSYYPHRGTKSSTWLTAFIAKVFTMAFKVVVINNSPVICGAIQWLIQERQKPEGIFHEEAPPHFPAIMGGLEHGEPSVLLTAFVLISIVESKEICIEGFSGLENSITKAKNYLSERYESLTQPYTVAVVSYALALAGGLTDETVLMTASTERSHWEDQNNHNVTVEGTSYALLALLRMKKFEYIEAVIMWLMWQNYIGNIYENTQSTTMILQAFTQYHLDMTASQDQNMFVSVFLPHRTPVRYKFDENMIISRSLETHFNEDFTVEASGKGHVTLTITMKYHKKVQNEKAQCKNFNLQVSVEEIKLGKEEPDKALPRAINIKICARYLGVTGAENTIIDISMLSGFQPDIEELKKLYEEVISNVVFGKGKLLIYLNLVSHITDTCLQLRAVGPKLADNFIQPGSVKIYTYDAPDHYCIMFYHTSYADGLLNKVCHNSVCQCMEENCDLQNVEKRSISIRERIVRACSLEVGYVYKTRLIKTEEIQHYFYYTMEILNILKQGSDEQAVHQTRIFIAHPKCNKTLELEKNTDYLIWSLKTDVWFTRQYYYLISQHTWIEKWPNQEECQEKKYQQLCEDLEEFDRTLTISGCESI